MSAGSGKPAIGPGGWVLERLVARGEGEPPPSPAEAAELTAWSPSLAVLLPSRLVLDELVGTTDPHLAVSTAQSVGALETLAPELSRTFGVDQRTPHHDFDVGTHLLRALAAMATLSDDLDLRLAALFHDVGKPEVMWLDESGRGHFYRDPGRPGTRDHAEVGAAITRRVLERHGYPQARVERVARLVEEHMFSFATAAGARRFLGRVGELDLAVDLLTLKEADEAGKRLPPQSRPAPRRERQGRLNRPRRG